MLTFTILFQGKHQELLGSSGNGGQASEKPCKDYCQPIPGSAGKEKVIMDEMNRIRNKGLYFPGILDCHQKAQQAVESQGLKCPSTHRLNEKVYPYFIIY